MRKVRFIVREREREREREMEMEIGYVDMRV
jgi:hypothetical protein